MSDLDEAKLAVVAAQAAGLVASMFTGFHSRHRRRAQRLCPAGKPDTALIPTAPVVLG